MELLESFGWARSDSGNVVKVINTALRINATLKYTLRTSKAINTRCCIYLRKYSMLVLGNTLPLKLCERFVFSYMVAMHKHDLTFNMPFI